MTRKLIINDGKTERELLLVGTMVVGRDPMCDVSAPDPLLSRRHAEFTAQSNQVLLRDLGSRNGILVNGVKVLQGALRAGDVVQIGHVQVKFVEDDTPCVAPTDERGDLEATVMAGAAAAPKQPQAPVAGAARPATPAPQASLDDLDQTLPPFRISDRPPMRAASADIDDPDKTRFSPLSVATPAPRPASPQRDAAPRAAAVTAGASPRQSLIAPAPNEYARAPQLDMQPFVAPDHRMRFEVPRREWQLVSGGTVAVVTLAAKSGQAAVVVEQTRLNQAMAQEDITNLFALLEADAVKERQPAAADVQAKLVAVDGRRLVIVTYSRRGVAGPERVRQYSIPTGSDLFRLTCSAAAPEFPRYEPVFAHVAATFATGAN